MAVQLEELHGRRLFDLQAEVAGDLPQNMIKVRKMIDGHVAHKRAADFVVTRAPMQPAKEKETLHARGKTNNNPGGVHGSVVSRASSIEAERQSAGPKSNFEAAVRRVARAAVEQLRRNPQRAAE